MMTSSEFQNVLYPFQDEVLRIIHSLDTSFYLTGGTAASRGYLHHRYSDDLDFFVNDDANFTLYADRVLDGIQKNLDVQLEVLNRQARFVRVDVTGDDDLVLKMEFVNDVPSHIGPITVHEVLGKIDSAENILANKVTAVLSREEPKDLADIWGFCGQMSLSLENAITGAKSKAAGIFPADLSRVLLSTTRSDWESIRWIDAPDPEIYVAELHELGEGLIFKDPPTK